MSAGARVATFVALLATIFVVAALAGRALHPRGDGTRTSVPHVTTPDATR